MSHTRRKSWLRLFCAGVSLILLVQNKIRDQRELDCFDGLAKAVRISRPAATEDSTLLAALHLTHHLLAGRLLLLSPQGPAEGSGYNGSLTDDLLTARGACGSFADVLCELLEHMGYTARIGQMKVNGRWGGHIITECLTTRGWVVLDAMYDQYFVGADGRLASCREVMANWRFFQGQLKPGYKAEYNYADIRYTNWDKIPIVLPLAREVLEMIIGRESTHTICLRGYFLRRYRIYFYLSLAMLLMLTAGAGRTLSAVIRGEWSPGRLSTGAWTTATE